MYGALARNGAYVLFGALFAAVINEILGPFISILEPIAGGTQYLRGLKALEGNVLLIIILAVCLGLLARAVVESKLPGGVR